MHAILVHGRRRQATELWGSPLQWQAHYFYGGAANLDTYFDSNYYPAPLEGRQCKVQQLPASGIIQ